MPIYFYTARDQSGRLQKGTVEAGSQKEAAGLIRDKGLLPITLTEPKKARLRFALEHLAKISLSDIVNFTRQLSTMVLAGLQIQEAIGLLKVQTTNSAMVKMLTGISREIQGGGNLASAVARYPRYFSTTYIALVRAGESSGTLDRVLERLADNMEKDLEFRSKVKGAMIYPTIILLAMVAVFTILMVVVVPKLTALYVDFGAELPLATRILQFISDTLVRWWWIVLILALIGFRIFRQWKRTDAGRRTWDGFVLRLPLLGKLQQEILLVEFTRTLGLLTGAGVHILESLDILIDSLNNIHYQDALKEITKKVEKGMPMGQLFAQYPIFPPILAQMIKVGEETGKMDESLIKLSVYFERESDHVVKGLTTAIEPFIMIVLGVGVGFIVFAIITPIYNITSQFK